MCIHTNLIAGAEFLDTDLFFGHRDPAEGGKNVGACFCFIVLICFMLCSYP
jgi:hypothetical protein